MRRVNDPVLGLANQSPVPWSRVGIAGFAFFLGKGLLWLLAPVLFALTR